MKIARIANVVLTLLSVSLLFSCQKVKEEEKKSTEVEVNFSVALNDVNATYAEVIVRHTGTDDQTWYGFVTTDLTSTDEDLIKAQLSQVNASNLHVGTSQTVAIPNLEELDTYRYIAFGTNKDGQRYGIPGSLIFTSSPDYDVTFQAELQDVNPHAAAIQITHDGNEVLTYRGFLTTDTDSEASALIAADYASIVENGKLVEGTELLEGTSFMVELDELVHETDYRYIVYGVYVEGDVAVFYGTAAECEFTTPIDLSLVSFSATVSGITTETAKVSVKYDAKQEDLTWYGFVSTDLTTPAETLIAAAVESITAGDYLSGAQQNLDIENLQMETEYRYIATGINSDGVYGIPADVRFTTLSQAYVNTVFSVVASDITAKGATITITHNGEEEFTYCGFFTEDMTSDLADIEIPDNADAHLMSGIEKVITFEDLKAITAYRYVVVGRVYGNEYGTRGEVKFETADYAVDAEYKDFLGNWLVQNGTKYEFVIKEKVAGQSYTISGLNASETAKYGISTPLVVEGIFADGKLTIASQAISEPYVDPEDEKTYTDMFCGRYSTSAGNYYDKTMGRTVVTLALCEDGTVELRPGTSYSGETYVGMRFYQVPASGSAYAQDNMETALPNTAKRAAEASEAYLKWLGDWNFSGITFRIAKAEANVNYNVYGFYTNMNSFPALVDFDEATGNIVFHHRLMDYTVNSTDGTTFSMYTTGINSLNYVAVRTGDETELATFSMNASGNGGTATGTTYMHSSGETTVTEIGLFGYSSSWTKWNGWNYLTLPCNFTKAEGTSAVSAAPSFVPTPGIGVQNFSVVRSKVNDKAFSKR